jgi:cytochrome P450
MTNVTQSVCPASVTDYEWPSLELAQCPFPFYEALRRDAPVYKYPGRNQWVVSRWKDITYVAEHTDLFVLDPEITTAQATDEPLSGMSMAGTNEPEHRRKRELGRHLVSKERLRSFEPMIRDISDDLIDQVVDRGSMEFYSEFSGQLPVRLVADVLGLPRADTAMFLSWYEHSAPAAVAFMGEDERMEQERLAAEARDYMRAAVRDRYENPRDDFLTEFLRLQVKQEGDPALEYVAAEADLMMFAGNLTTTHMLASMMIILLQHPEEQARVLEDRSLLPMLVEETLRLESPVQWLLRYTTQDVEVGGVPIPTGAHVAMIWASGNRDPERFDEPERLDLSRPRIVKDQLAFGRGIHRYLGAPMARLEGRVAFDQVFNRLKNLQLDPIKNDFTYLENLLFRAPRAAHITFEAA